MQLLCCECGKLTFIRQGNQWVMGIYSFGLMLCIVCGYVYCDNVECYKHRNRHKTECESESIYSTIT